MSKIKDIIGREIIDSRGNPTVEVDVILESGVIGRASVPSGASTGSREVLELRDNDDRFNGMGVSLAISNINNEIRNVIKGISVFDQRTIDMKMTQLDGTFNKSRLGGNAILGVSLAVLHAASNELGVPLYRYISDGKLLPDLMINILNGGVHADNKLDIQEFMIVPHAKLVKEKIRIGAEVFHSLKSILKEKGLSTNVGDEGGFAPNLSSTYEALDLIVMAIERASYIPGKDVSIALDVAASTLFHDSKYFIDNNVFSSDELVLYYKDLCFKYPIISIEDPFDESDFDGFCLITKELSNVWIVGDDLFVTNKKYLQEGIDRGCCNAVLIKMNQVGTITEMLDTIDLANKNDYKTIISHRSGETEDTSICDIAVSLNLGVIKTGSLSRGERVSKYNRLIRIEEEILRYRN